MVSGDGSICVTNPAMMPSDPIIMQTVLEAEAAKPCCTTGGCDVWNGQQILSEDQSTGFYMDTNTGNLSFVLGAKRLTVGLAALISGILIAVNAL